LNSSPKRQPGTMISEPTVIDLTLPPVMDGQDATPPLAESKNRDSLLDRAREVRERAGALSKRMESLAQLLARRLEPSAESSESQNRSDRAGVESPPAPAGRGAIELVAETQTPDEKAESRLKRLFGARVTTQGVLFVQPAQGQATVHVAGEFNAWNPRSMPMQFDPALRVWQLLIPLEPGNHRYRIVADGRWTHDAFNPYIEVNSFGQLNSVIEVGIKD